jgi:hypothetical protein
VAGNGGPAVVGGRRGRRAWLKEERARWWFGGVERVRVRTGRLRLAGHWCTCPERRACILLNVVIPSLAFTGRSISRRVHHPQVRISPDHSVFDSPTQLNAHNTPPALSDISGLPINSTQKSNLESVIFPFLSSKSPAITQQRLSRPFI